MSDVTDHENVLLESTTNLVIDNSKTVSRDKSYSHSQTYISVSPLPSSEASTYVGNKTYDSSINTEPRDSKSKNTVDEGKSTEYPILNTHSIDKTVPSIPPIITNDKYHTEPFPESLSTSPTSPSAYTTPRESFKSHSATSSTSTLTPEDQERISTKEKNLDEIKQQCSCLIHELEGNDQPEVIIKRHIQQLKKYNELKDVALQLVTLIADQRQVKTTDILNEMKLEVGEDGNEI